MSLNAFFRKKVPKPPPTEDAASIGNLAITLGYITEEILKKALKTQKDRLKLGEILVEMEAITRDQLNDLLFEQHIRREQVPVTKIIEYEKKKKRRQLYELGNVFKEATCHANKFVAAMKKE